MKNNKIYTLDEIRAIATPVFEKYPTIKKAYLFGSYARGEAEETSDLDFMVELKDYSIPSLKDELRVEESLKEVFNKSIDTLNEQDAYKIMKKTLERDKVLIYER